MLYSDCLRCSTVDYGGTQVVAGDTIQEVIHQCTPRETIRDFATSSSSSTKQEMMNFFARYAICALPKEETRRILNAYAAKRWNETRNLQDTIENWDAEHYYACILDRLTASDIAFLLWST